MRNRALRQSLDSNLHDMPHRIIRVIIVVCVPSALPLLLVRFRRARRTCRGGPSGVTCTLATSASRTEFVLPLGAELTPRDSMRKYVLLNGRPGHAVPADDARGSGERAMALKDALQPDARLDVVDILSVIAEKLGGQISIGERR